MTPDKLAVAQRMYDEGGHTLAAIAATINVSRSTLTATWVPKRRRAPESRPSRGGSRLWEVIRLDAVARILGLILAVCSSSARTAQQVLTFVK